MALKAQAALGGNELSVVADKGYYNGKEVLLCDTIGVRAYVAKPLTSANTAQGLYGKEKFKYDAPHNCYHCPAGRKVTYLSSRPKRKAGPSPTTGRMTAKVVP
jgi:hypothetical protein